MIAPILSVLERVLNQALAHDPRAKQRLEALSGRVLSLSVTDWSLACYVIVNGNRMLLSQDYAGAADVSLSGPSFALLRLASSRDTIQTLQQDVIVLSGDMHVAGALKTLVAELEIDWEGAMAQHTGDAFAHEFGIWGRHAIRFVKRCLTKMRVDLTEGIQEEMALAPSRKAVGDFCDQVDQLRLDVDRLLFRTQKLRGGLLLQG